MSKLLKFYRDVIATQITNTDTPGKGKRHVYLGTLSTAVHPYRNQEPGHAGGTVPELDVFGVNYRKRREGTDHIYEIREFTMKYLGEDPKFFRRERVEIECNTRVVTLDASTSGNFGLHERHKEEFLHHFHVVITDSGKEVEKASVTKVGATTEHDDVQTVVWTIDDFREIDGLEFGGWSLSPRFHLYFPRAAATSPATQLVHKPQATDAAKD